jgi:hypothetical protein
MKRYRGNQRVEPGVYLHVSRLSLESPGSDGRLPGDKEDEYRRISLLALLAAPVVGGLYVVFLPLLGMAMMTWVAGAKAVELLAHAGTASSRVSRPSWKPGTAFLSRGKQAREATSDEDAWAAAVKKQLDETSDKRGAP